ncbi:plasmid replication initiator TrfA [Zophobihabitans entericus]|uniref:TrfA protein n=1 Tax=Zophobihabitans entericus TaxID=1635327 RepID=A0A6G9IG00_9GAMM|nr:plasmid replication initiator TrfA [Zophobihabitans entericus]QIQ22540.1 TrfA protein [Zophobihabitans entericus]
MTNNSNDNDNENVISDQMSLSLFQVAPWNDEMRGIPNDYARSALFTVRNKRVKRTAILNQPIYSANKNVTITYTGVELRAEDDELVWQQVLEFAKRTVFGEWVEFTFYELCKEIGWPINGNYYAKAEDCLSRLQASAVRFTSNRPGLYKTDLESISFLDRFRVQNRGDKSKSRCQVKISKDMVNLFIGNHYSRISWLEYRELSPIARRMYDYFSTHKEPFPLALDSFKSICASDVKTLKKWREMTKKACKELEESKLVKAIWVDNDYIKCVR